MCDINWNRILINGNLYILKGPSSYPFFSLYTLVDLGLAAAALLLLTGAATTAAACPLPAPRLGQLAAQQRLLAGIGRCRRPLVGSDHYEALEPTALY